MLEALAAVVLREVLDALCGVPMGGEGGGGVSRREAGGRVVQAGGVEWTRREQGRPAISVWLGIREGVGVVARIGVGVEGSEIVAVMGVVGGMVAAVVRVEVLPRPPPRRPQAAPWMLVGGAGGLLSEGRIDDRHGAGDGLIL